MPRKLIRSKRKTGRRNPFNSFSLHYELRDLIRNPDKMPSMCELLTLQEHGVTIEEFRKRHVWFRNAFDKSKRIEPGEEFIFK